MPNKINSIGKTFNFLTIISEAPTSGRNILVFANCICGKTIKSQVSAIRNGHIKSCGCKRNTFKTHGFSNKRLYHIWENMKQRCYNPNALKYNNYGGRGIEIISDWLIFSNFKDWALNNGYSDILTLDRIDNEKGYNPINCRWITNLEQQSNSRKNVWITYNGETLTISQWSRRTGIPRQNIGYRFKAGYPIEKVLTPSEYK